jgi:hypothetical protein
MGNAIREIASKIVFKSDKEKLKKSLAGTFFEFEALDIDGN